MSRYFLNDWANELKSESKYPVFEPGDLVSICSWTSYMDNMPPEQVIEVAKTQSVDDIRDFTGVWRRIVPEGEPDVVGLVVGYLPLDPSQAEERIYFIMVGGALLTFPFVVGIKKLRTYQDSVQHQRGPCDYRRMDQRDGEGNGE